MENGKIERLFKSFFLTIIFLIASSFSIQAAEHDTTIVCKVVKHGLTDTKNYLLSPTKWDEANWLMAGTIASATTALVLWADQPVYEFQNKHHNPSLDVLFRYSEPFGNYYPMAAISAFAITGLISKDNYTMETALIAAESFAFSGVAVQIIKTIPGRARPNNQGTTNPHQWEGPFFKGNSFYSGHTTSAFSVASVFAYRYKETVWVPVLAYSLATLGGLQRIYNNRHWASDVLFGAATGTFTGVFLCKQWEKRPIRFYPIMTNKGAGLSMQLNF